MSNNQNETESVLLDSKGTAGEKLNIEKIKKEKSAYLVFKHIGDVFFSLLALIVLFPLMIIVALAIVIDSPSAGPIFVQTRVGKDGKLFRFYKFRSMRPNAEAELDSLKDKNEMDGPVFKIKDDPRVTRVGKIIRKTCIDELPQLVNIIKGDMTIIGPRPALPKEVEEYGEYERQRLAVKPGLSCYWQIMPHRNEMTFRKWMDLDMKYIKEASFSADFKIILKSVLICLGCDGI